jgi:hypothetical protein
MPARTAKQFLAEWHELAMLQDEARDSDIADGLGARASISSVASTSRGRRRRSGLRTYLGGRTTSRRSR